MRAADRPRRRAIGVLNLIRRKDGVFSAEQLKMARLFSTRAAAAIENARLHQETLRSLDEQRKLLAQRDALWSVNAAVYRAGTLEESLDRIVRLAPAALGVDLCAVDLARRTRGRGLPRRHHRTTSAARWWASGST